MGWEIKHFKKKKKKLAGRQQKNKEQKQVSGRVWPHSCTDAARTQDTKEEEELQLLQPSCRHRAAARHERPPRFLHLRSRFV